MIIRGPKTLRERENEPDSYLWTQSCTIPGWESYFAKSGTSVFSGHIKTRSGTGVPGWQSAPFRGVSATSAYSRNDTLITPRVVYGSASYQESIPLPGKPPRSGTISLSGTYAGVNPLGPGVSQDEKDAASLHAASQAFQQSLGMFRSGVFLGEIRETARLLRHPLRSLTELAEAFYKPSKSGKIRNIVNKSSGAFLEWTYGAKPLMRDLVDAALATQNVIMKKNSYRDRGAGTAINRSALGPYVQPVGSFSFYDHWSTTTEYRVSVAQGHLLTTRTSDIVYREFGFDWRGIPDDLWNLIPYTFLVDYVSNLSDIINSPMIATRTPFYGSRSVTETNLCQAWGGPVKAAPIISGWTLVGLSGSLGPAIGRSSSFNRNSYSPSTVLTAPLVFNFPSSDHLVNMAALLANKLSGSIKRTPLDLGRNSSPSLRGPTVLPRLSF